MRGWLDSVHQGYRLDPGRTAVAGGRPNAGQQALIDDLVGIVTAVIAAIRPEARTMAIAAQADALIAQAGGNQGGPSAVLPCVAHGIGLHWEPPYIGSAVLECDEIIEADMVMGLEYFLTREGVGTAGIEENFIVGRDRNESITYLPLQGW